MNALAAQLKAYWQARLPREQRILSAGAVAALLLLWIGALVLPLAAEVRRVERELPPLRATQASLEAMAEEAQSLSAGPKATPLPPEQREAAVRHAIARASLGEAKNIQVQMIDSAHVRVHCDDTDYGQWLAWLYPLQDELGARVSSATVISRASNGFSGRVKADVVLAFDDGKGAS